MLNAIRITIGVVMAAIAFGLTFALIALAIGYRSDSTSSLQSILTFAVIVSLPLCSAWLLLFPKTKNNAIVGLILAVIFLICYILFTVIAKDILFRS